MQGTSTHGGYRPNSGRKKREETTTTGFRINTEALNVAREKYGRTLNAVINDFIKQLVKQ
jgi:hypothetical protein